MTSSLRKPCSPDPSAEPSAAGAARSLPDATVEWLFESSQLGIALWDCAAGGRGLSAERRPLWHVVSFVHSGAFVLHAQGRSTVVDATSVLFHNPEDPFRSEHPFGRCDHGSFIGVHQEVLLGLLADLDPAARDRLPALFPRSCVHGLFSAYMLQRLLVRRLQAGPPADFMAVEEGVLEVLGGVVKGYRQAQGPAAVHRDPSRARRCYAEDVKALLQKRFRERLQLDDI